MIKTEFDKSQKWVIEGTGEADVYRIVKEDKSDWIAVLRCNAIHTPGMQSGDGITNVKAIVAAPELLAAAELAKQFIDYVESAKLNLWSDKLQLMYRAKTSLDNAIKKAIE